jgi:hypothetical protein
MLRAEVASLDVSVEPLATRWAEWIEDTKQWIRDEAVWYCGSFVFHLLLLCVVALVGSHAVSNTPIEETMSLQPAKVENIEPETEPWTRLHDDPTTPELTPIEPTTPYDTTPSEMSPNTAPTSPSEEPRNENWPSDAAKFGNPQGFGSEALPNTFQLKGLGSGALLRPPRGYGPSHGTSNHFGPGGGHFGPRGNHHNTLPVIEAAVQRALLWLARHQAVDGSWSIDHYTARCRDASCTGPGTTQADAAGTGLGVLPFLANGNTHRGGPYRKNVAMAIAWLVRHEKPDGDLTCGSTMYAHGLAAIALCEAYGMSGDSAIGAAAQRALDFIAAAQNPTTGGWRYKPGDEGDTSVVGWQVMALKSGQMAGLRVDPTVLERAARFLKSTAKGASQGSLTGSQFAYQPNMAPTAAMTSVGLLCSQYLGVQREDPAMVEGTAYLGRNLPDSAMRNFYYWYYAMQVMHNQPGPEWDAWDRKTRRLLVESQCHEGCAAGSWDPQKPSPDAWAVQGGRLMTTCLGTLTLEVYYRYLPLYTLGAKDKAKHAL